MKCRLSTRSFASVVRQAADGDQRVEACGRARGLHVVAQGQAAHAVHDREDAGLLQVECLLVVLAEEQPVPPAAARVGERIDRGGKAAEPCVVGRDEVIDLAAHAGQQRRVAGHGMRVDEDGERHQALRIGLQQPVAHRPPRTRSRCAARPGC